MRFIAERLLIKKILYAPKIEFKSYLCASIIFLSLSACTRPQSEESTSGTKIYLTLPATLSNSSGKMNAASAPTLEHVILNINGSGMAPIFYSWDSCRDCATSTTPPTSFTFDILQGSSRLFQVLAVYKTDDGQMIFKYGDMVKDLSAAEETVPIVIASLGDGAYAVSGQISGRIIDADSGATASGPTGDVDIKFNPGNGKPALTISHGVITNGWFSFFGITGASFDYILKDTGRNLFNGSVDLNSFTPSDTVLKVAIPKHQRKTYISGTVTWIADEPQIYIWGYFGDAAAGITGSERKICRDFSAGFTSMATADSGQSGSPVLTKTLLSPGSDFPTNVNLFNANLSAVSYKGGVSVTSGTCVGVTLDSSNLFYRFQEITSTLIDGNGKDSSAGFFNPFQSKIIGSSPQPFELSGSTSNLTLVGGLLPGERESLSEILLFKTNNTNLENAHEDSLNCDEILSGWGGFVPAGTLDVTSLANNNWSMSTNISTTEAQTTGFKAIMCMRTSGGLGSQILKTGVVLYSHLFTCSTCKTLHLSWSVPAFNTTPPNLYLGQCPYISGELKQSGTTINASSSITITYNDANVTLRPYLGSASALSSIIVNSLSSSLSSSACLQPTVVGAGMMMAGWSISASESVLIDDSLLTWSAQKAQLKPIVPATLVKNNVGGEVPICYPVTWRFYDADNLPVNISVQNVNLQFGAALEVFNDLNNCQNVVSSSIATGATSIVSGNISNSAQYFVRVLSSTSATSNFMTSSDAGNAVTHGNTTLALPSGPGENASIELSLGAGPYQTGECYSIKASLQNAAGNSVVAKTDLTFTLNFSVSDKVKIYSDETCTSIGTGSYQIMSGQFEKNLSFKSYETVGSLNLTGMSGAVRIDSPTTGGGPISIEDHIGTEPILSLSVPNIKTSTLAQGQTLEIAVTKDASATLACWKSLDSGTTYSTCATGAGGNFNSSTSKIILQATSASSNDWQPAVQFKITATLSGQTKTIYFNPYVTFGYVTVMDCTIIVDSTAGGYSFSADVDSNYISTYVVCLKPGSYVGNLIRGSLASTDHPSLIGYLNPVTGGHSVTWSPNTSSSVPILSLTNTAVGEQPMTLANLNINDTGWVGNNTGLVLTNLGNHYLTVDGVSISLSRANNSAFKRIGSSDIILKNMDFLIQAGCSAGCFAFESSAVASVTSASNLNFTINNPYAYAISLGLTNTFLLDGSNANGVGGFLSRTTGAVTTMEFKNLKIAQASSTNRTFLLKENDHLQLKNSFVQTASVAQMFYLDVTSATTPPRVSLIDSKLKMMSNAPLISSSAYVTTATVGNPNLITTRTHIIRAGSGAATSYMAEPYNASTWYWGKHNLGSPGVSLTGDSKVCRTGSLNWQGLVSAGSTFQLTDGSGASALPTVGTSTDGDFCD